jgi:glycosyltransferase involved in cell wall biosynthesis
MPDFLRVIADAGRGAELVPWSLETEFARLAECHVGLAPLPSDPFTRGKCGYKLLQYYAAGLPAVASPVGVHRTMAEGGALLARTPAEWTAALRQRRRARGPGAGLSSTAVCCSALAERLKRILA